MSRIEKGLLDKIINAKLLRKRKLSHASSYYFNEPKALNSRLIECMYFPKNRLEKFIANCYERCMPGLQFFVWNEQVRWAREYGYTISEKLYHSWLRVPNIQYHAMTQQLHPWGWLENQRRDQFIRKVTVLIPGLEAPDWAQQNRRVPDIVLPSIKNPQRALKIVIRESTPKPHYNQSLYTAPHHALNQRFNFGYPAQRLFFNEELRGDFYRTGYLNDQEKETIHGWYSDSQKNDYHRIKNMNKDEKADYAKRVQRWQNNMNTFYPELSEMKCDIPLHKYEEPYYERNLEDIRHSIYSNRLTDAINNSKFNETELQQIYEFFLNKNESVFFEKDSDNTYHGTDLYYKFIKELNFPDVFKIDKFTSYPPEKQFWDLMDRNWMINFDTVESFRARYVDMIKDFGIDRLSSSGISSLVLEEVYNQKFRMLLNEALGQPDITQKQSFVIYAIENQLKTKEELDQLANQARDEVYIASRNVLGEYARETVRSIVSTFKFNPGNKKF